MLLVMWPRAISQRHVCPAEDCLAVCSQGLIYRQSYGLRVCHVIVARVLAHITMIAAVGAAAVAVLIRVPEGQVRFVIRAMLQLT